MKKFKISVSADKDLRNIAEYTYKKWGKSQRDTYIHELFEAFNHLSQSPEMAMCIDAIKQGYRKFPQGSHVIYFRTSDSHNIEIIRILHKSMDAKMQLIWE